MRSRVFTKDLQHDVIIIVTGIILAFLVVRWPVFGATLQILQPFYPFAAFLAGIFFTSAFTLAPSAIVLAKIAETAPGLQIALWGGLGAMVGDMVIFLFIRDRFAVHLSKAFKRSQLVRVFIKTFHFGFMKWLSPVLGALIIASPLPDEFGLALMGLSRVKLIVLMPIAFVMNVLGIIGLISFAHLWG
ncbi:MAG: hypothetical protein HZA80_01120 [Candidatus Taylorbacteria bacterium]|nr:hypothetical protein [Candidatus Taylorbacteria bacterium]